MNPGQRIKNLREAKNINQTTLAQTLGISSAALSAIEKGKNNPNYETLIGISNFFKVSIDYILTGKEELTGIADDELEILAILREDNALKKAVIKATNLRKKALNDLVDYKNSEQDKP